jgi:hypothetical protein
MGSKEADMPSTLTPTCSFCGLRFASRPLLELHIREDHRQHDYNVPGGAGPAEATASPPRADVPARSNPRASTTPSAAKEVITMAATQQPRRHRRFGWTMIALRGLIRTLRHVNDELLLASELMFRPPGAPRTRPVPPPHRMPL